ncbi:MAG: endonuclease/exonuclease/phosphatase family protein [archaeon]
MDKKLRNWLLLGVLAAGIAVGIGGCYLYKHRAVEKSTSEQTQTIGEKKSFTVCNWNMEVFGKEKGDNAPLLKEYAEVLGKYDVAFIQEIRDDKSAFNNLAKLMSHHKARVSSRAGRSNSKEQYGVFCREGMEIIDFRDYNPDSQDRWERPPIKVSVKKGNYVLQVYNIHTRPSDVKRELQNLEGVVENHGNVMVLGDLNASGKRTKYQAFIKWDWIIKDGEDTTSTKAISTFDRIILNNDADREFIRYGINTNTTRAESNHYPVWIEMASEEK